MQNPSSILADRLAKRFRKLESSRKKIELLAGNGYLSNTATSHVYDGLFLNAHVAFEGYLEDLFIGLLVDGKGLQSSRSDIVPRLVVRSFSVAREILIGPGRRYIDWLPYDQTIKRAKLHFRGGRPFADLGTDDVDHLLRCNTIRNAIAHRSRFSLNKFEKIVIAGLPLPSHERSPSGYLRGLFRISPAQTRYEIYIARLLNIAQKLSK